jgi:tungstate transport system ATP-binding protein
MSYTDEPILEVENLKKKYDGFSFEVSRLRFLKGKIYGLTGPNGSGKTTFLSILNLLEEPDSGAVIFRGQAVTSSRSQRLKVRRSMALVMENPYMFRTTVMNNLTYGLRIRSADRGTLDTKANEALAMVQLNGFENRKAEELSRGELQRVAIARAIILNPEILFLDEPFTNVDRANVDVLESLIKDMNKRKGTTVIFTTHDLFQAYRLSDEIVSIVHGRIVNGSIENLFTGRVERRENAEWIRVTPDISIAVVTERRGEVHALIPPEDIILSKDPFQSSARNVLKGRIKKIEMEEETVRICCDAGIEFTALITKKSFDRMQLSIGSELFLTFKTTAVKVF